MQFQFNYASDASLFRARVGTFLAEHEAENNLVLGILAGIVDGRQKFSDEPPLLVAVEDAAGIRLVALRTPPLNLLLTVAASDEAVRQLGRELHLRGYRLPGVTAPSREAEVFAKAWSELSGARIRQAQAQRIYSLERVNPPRPVAGRLHRCGEQDLALATDWIGAFSRDVGELQVAADPRRYIGQRDAGLFFWVDQRPVAMAGFSGPTPNGIRIGLVYTPAHLRRRGYASACVAALSRRLLDEGAGSASFTPTSKIQLRITSTRRSAISRSATRPC